MKKTHQTITGIVVPLLMALMWLGLFHSRALLSISMALFVAATLAAVPLRGLLSVLRGSVFLRCMPLLFCIPLLSGFWSTDTLRWMGILQDKLPLLAMPLCAGVFRHIPGRRKRQLLVFASLVTVASMGGVAARYLSQPAETAASYLAAKVLRVDMGDDHVRYGWLLAAVCGWMAHLLLDGGLGRKLERWAAGGMMFATAAFLHLLSSRTGLLCLYISLLTASAYHVRRPLVRRLALLMPLAPVAAWLLLPTFRNRLRFAWWDFQNLSRGGYTEGLSDTPRFLSLKGGMDLFSGEPLLGTGFGDLRTAMDAWYAANAPYLQAYERLLPSQEALLHAAAAGIPGLAALLAAILSPFRMPPLRKRMAWTAFHLMAIATFVYEIGLETQYGVFIYAFLGCWLHEELQPQNPLHADSPTTTA